MTQAVLEGTILAALLLQPTDLVHVVHLKDGVLTEAHEAFELPLVAAHLDGVEEVPT